MTGAKSAIVAGAKDANEVTRGRRAAWSGALIAALLAVGGAAIGCGKGRSGAPASGSASGVTARAPGLWLRLALAEDSRAIDVAIRVTGPEASKVRALRATRGWADTHALVGVRDLRVRDAQGPIEAKAPMDEERFTILPLARAVVGDELIVEYTARANAEVSRLSLHRGASGVSGVGHAFLVRPAISAELPLAIAYHGASSSPSMVFASSLDGRAKATVEDLATAVYVAGTGSGDRSASGRWASLAVGSSIDARAATAIFELVSGVATKAFGIEERERGEAASLFVIGERGVGVEHDGASTGGAIALWLDAERTMDDDAKILVAHEAYHRVFGGLLRVGIEGYEAAWFTEGFATYYARRSLFAERSITAESFVADLERTDGERSAAAHAGDRRASEYSRGSRYAAALDATLRLSSAGVRSLDDVVRALIVEARKAKDEPVSVESFRAIVAKQTGPDKERALWQGLVENRLPDLPDGAFGPCFRRSVELRTAPELGFDASSLGSAPQIIHGTVPGSAAARAGVQDGDLVLRSSLRPGEEIDPKAEIELVVSAAKGKKRIRYKPAATARRVVFKPQPCASSAR